MRTKTVIAAALIAVFLGAAPAKGQIVYGQPASSSLRFYYSDWSLGDDNGFSQGTTALSGFVPLSDNMEGRFYFASAFNSLDLYGTESDLSGVGDLRLQVSRSFSNDRILLSGGLNLPTGKTGLDPEGEGSIIGFLSRDYISVPMRRFGQGFGFNLQMGGAAELGRFKCGASAVFDFTGTYEPYDGSGDYDPGNSLSLNATAAGKIGPMDCTGDMGFSYFTKDKLDDRIIYRQAPQFGGRFTASLTKRKFVPTFGAKFMIRGRNTRYNVIDEAIESQLKKYGNEFDIFARLTRVIDEWRMSATAGTRQIMASEEEFGRTSLFNLGIDISKKIAQRAGLDIGLLYQTGSTDGGDTDLRGILVSSGLTVDF